MAPGICQLIGLERLMEDLHVSLSHPARLYNDNNSTISIVNNLMQHDRMKYIRIDQSFIKMKTENRGINLSYISRKSQLADVLSKAISRLGSIISKL